MGCKTNLGAWGKLGETCNQYLTKRSQVYIEGRLSSRSYESNGQTRFSMEINLTDVQFLGGSQDREQVAAGFDPDEDGGPDDLPF